MSNTQEPAVEMHGHMKEYTIVVNAREKKVTTDELSYEKVVAIAYNSNPPAGPNIIITVTYRNAAEEKQGSLMAGQSVVIKEGTLFDVTATNRS